MGFILIIIDMSRVRVALEVLRENENALSLAMRSRDRRFGRLIDSITKYGIYSLSPTGLVTSWNAGAERVTGYRPDEIIGKHFSRFFTPEDQAHGVPDQLLEAAQTDGRFVGEGWRVRKDGTLFWASVVLEPIRDDSGHLTGFAKVTNDLSELHRAEAVRQTLLARANKASHENSAKSRFLAGMSHELRTPLTGILGYAQLLRLEGGLNPKQFARVDAMETAGKHLLQMIDTVLDMSKIESERFEPQSIPFDLHAVAAAAMEVIRPTAEAKGLVLRLLIEPDLPKLIVGDPVRVRQILVNLLGNAAKFTTQGSIELHVRLALGGLKARFEVLDTGPGVSDDKRRRLFQDFERGDDPVSASVDGAGLGLAISARLAALLGGLIGQEPNPHGRGSLFWLELPVRGDLAGPELEGDADPGNAAGPAAARLRPLRILIVDDVAMNRDVAGSMLRAGGHQAFDAASGAQAVAAAGASDFDVILMDVRMPGMDGLEATRRIRALPGGRGKVPVIALTAQVFSQQIDQCRQAGMTGYVAKPFLQEALLNAVESSVKPTDKDMMAPPESGVFRDLKAAGPNPADGPRAPGAGGESPGAASAVVNRHMIDDLVGLLGRDHVAALLRTFRQQKERLRLKEPADDAQRTALEDDMHTLCSSAGTLGFTTLSNNCRRLEHALGSGLGIRPAFDDVVAIFAQAGPVLDALIDELTK
jgi:PAS domain S-box-containing protein